ncbi:SipW-dependent-type signal peptide-containing protein [Microbacterium candidum]|uniref:SipW-dependent-type signal peptide-containing protein n=1 Tax=Microbacterium candidum TaxID=3041922 RepID=A0ABT7MX13_9MICO|nr:SipW-dependent-type signal peptide-containing protein [Microbacterium sp. ASV49]MDL9978993.1 SipW-dependent-type signal peptide-containing protein [Microbacterium sp. ASV49]
MASADDGRRRDRARRRRRLRWMRARALLAGGLVLGVGASITFAAWTDSEYATTTVASGRFGIVGAVNGGSTFTDHATTPGATLTFSPALTAVYPGSGAGFTTVQIRTAAVAAGGFDSVPGVVRMQTSTAATGNLASALVYAVRVVPSGSSCNEALFANATAPVIVPNATPLTTSVPTAPDMPQTLQAAGGSTVTFCVRIELPTTAPDTSQNGTASVVWLFAGATS